MVYREGHHPSLIKVNTMISHITISNMALDKLGQKPIISFTEKNNKNARLCKREYPGTRDSLLRQYPWNFAINRTTLATESTPETWGYLYSHPLPFDCLRVLNVRDLSRGEYAIEGRAILSNTAGLDIRYVQRVENPNLFDDLFVEALAFKLAINIEGDITKNLKLHDQLLREYKVVLNTAFRIDSQESPIVQVKEDSWITARY